MKLKKRMMTGMLAATLGAMAPVLAQTAEPSPYSSYLFAFFSNNSPYGEQVRYALSDDGYNYTSLNQGHPVVASDTIALTLKGLIEDGYILYAQWLRTRIRWVNLVFRLASKLSMAKILAAK